MKKNRQAWDENYTLLMELLSQPNNTKQVYIADCDAVSARMELASPRICQYQGGKEAVGDLLEQRHFLAEKCFSRYNEGRMETGFREKPVKRRFVKIPCPGRSCDPNRVCQWICFRCLAPVEYGFSDRYIYCECGRCLYSDYDFKCNSEHLRRTIAASWKMKKKFVRYFIDDFTLCLF